MGYQSCPRRCRRSRRRRPSQGPCHASAARAGARRQDGDGARSGDGGCAGDGGAGGGRDHAGGRRRRQGC